MIQQPKPPMWQTTDQVVHFTEQQWQRMMQRMGIHNTFY
jgi:hypothetical protein